MRPKYLGSLTISGTAYKMWSYVLLAVVLSDFLGPVCCFHGSSSVRTIVLAATCPVSKLEVRETVILGSHVRMHSCEHVHVSTDVLVFTSHAHTRMDTNRVHVAVVFSLVLKCGDQYDTFLHKKPAPTSSTQGADHQSHIRTIDIPCRFGFSPGSSRRRIWVAGETFSVRQFPGVLAETAKYTVLDRRIRDAEFGRG